MPLNRAVIVALLLAGCSQQEVADEPVTAFDEGQNATIEALTARIDKIEQRQTVVEQHVINQPMKAEKTGVELLAEQNEKRKLERRVDALDHQY